MEQSSLLRVLRDLTNENKELFKEHSNTLPSSRASSQVALRLSINGDVTSRSFPLDSERRSLTHIEEQVSIIFYPYLSKSKPVKKIRMFYIGKRSLFCFV